MYGLKTRHDDLDDIENALTAVQSAGISIPDPQDIYSYLSAHRDMLRALRIASKACAATFGSGTQLSLELYRDPEIDDEYVTIYARQQPYEDNILDLVDAVSEEVSPELKDITGWLHITTDFKPSR